MVSLKVGTFLGVNDSIVATFDLDTLAGSHANVAILSEPIVGTRHKMAAIRILTSVNARVITKVEGFSQNTIIGGLFR